MIQQIYQPESTSLFEWVAAIGVPLLGVLVAAWAVWRKKHK